MGLNGPHRLGLILVGIILLYVPSVVWLQQRVSVAHTPDAAGSVTLPVEAPQPDPVQKPRVVAVSRAKQDSESEAGGSSKTASFDQISQDIYEQLTLEQRVGQLVLIALPGYTLNSTAKEFIRRTLPGGLLLCPYHINQAHWDDADTRLVVTDDIKMKGLGTSVWNATVRSVQSGADLVLTSNKDDMYQTVCDMVDSLRAAVVAGDIPEARLRESVTRVIRHKLRYGVMTWDGTRPALGAVPEPPPAHRAVLQAADEVNRQLSRQGLFWHGPTGLLTPAADVRRLFVIHRPQFRNALRLRDGDQAFVGLSQFAKRKRPPKGAGASQAVAYLYMPDADAKKAQEMHRLAEDLPLVILAAGNPFRFARYTYCKGMLFSFSTSYESIMAMAAALNGDLMPHTSTSNMQIF